MDSPRQYIAIDLKSFYASVECVERKLDPLDTCLVVADKSRTDKTICLAVSPALKEYGIGGRPRLFEVIQQIRQCNFRRGKLGSSYSKRILATNNKLAIDYLVAPPRMALYIAYSAKIYGIYLRYVAPEDIHVYSIDEVFMDVTNYLSTYQLSPHQLAMKMIREVLAETGITATAGIGTNLYLCKVAMDIVAKKMPPDRDGVRIAELNETSYRHLLWTHKPLTDFWRIGRSTAMTLAQYGIETMGDIARCSLEHEDFLYELFGVNTQLLIDHAWGWEPVTMPYIKSYRPATKSLSTGQVLAQPYCTEDARTVACEMIDNISLKLVEQCLITDQLTLTIGYDNKSLENPYIASQYFGRISIDHYGRKVPIQAHGTINLSPPTSSTAILTQKIGELYDRIVCKPLLIRRITIAINHLSDESIIKAERTGSQQLHLFVDYQKINRQRQQLISQRNKERNQQKTLLIIKRSFGKNAILKGLNYAKGATQRQRNQQIGGHSE